jgi:hypothetical protein
MNDAPRLVAAGVLVVQNCPSTFSIEIGNERTRVPVA